MKTKFIALAFLLPVFLSCVWPESKPANVAKSTAALKKTAAAKDSLLPATTDTILLKDLNNDKIDDTAFVYTPPTLFSFDEQGHEQYGIDCAGNNCYNKITFSCALPEIKFESSVWGTVENAGDLNGDGICELLFVPGWFTSSMTKLYLYSCSNGKWAINTSVEYRRNDAPLKPSLIKKGKKYYLRGVDLSDGDDRPYEVQIKFKK